MTDLQPGTRVRITTGSLTGRSGVIVERLDLVRDAEYLDPAGAYSVAIDGDSTGRHHHVQGSWLTPES